MTDTVAPTQILSTSPPKVHQLRRGSPHPNTGGRGGSSHHPQFKNKTWVSASARNQSQSPAPEGRWERGGHAQTFRNRGSGLHAVNGRISRTDHAADAMNGGSSIVVDVDTVIDRMSPVPPVASGATKTWEELVKAREEERIRAIREGRLDDPTIRKGLSEAITIVGTCQDMCPEFERYRRERENNLDKWECIRGPDGKPTKKVDHARAVKIYERGQGDKIVPSDLRPAPILKRTLDYLFYDLIPRGGFADTQAFVRDRSRAVRNDFTIQQDGGPIAIECHERCARYHILSLHLMHGNPNFDMMLEHQQLMNSLLSLRDFYDDQREVYESPNELEMRIYHRLGLIRDQQERNDKPPPHIENDPAYMLIMRFRAEVQAASSPITKKSKLIVSTAAMQTFAELADVLRKRRNIVMIYLTACFLENIFGKDTIEDMESIKGPLSIQDIIDGNSESGKGDFDDAGADQGEATDDVGMEGMEEEDDLSAFIDADEVEIGEDSMEEAPQVDSALPSPLKRGATQWLTENFGSAPTPPSEMANASYLRQSVSTPGFSSPFGSNASPNGTDVLRTTGAGPPPGGSVFGQIVSSSTAPSPFGAWPSSVFGGASNVFGSGKNIFGGPVFGIAPQITASPIESAEEPTKNSSFQQPTTNLPMSKSAPEPLIPLKGTSSSLADSAPLSSAGEEDRVPLLETVNPPRLPPFQPQTPPAAAHPQSSLSLDPAAPSFIPGSIRPLTSTPPSSGPRAVLTPLRTDSLLQSVFDQSKRSFSTPTGLSSSFPFPSPSGKPNGASLTINTRFPTTSTGQIRKAVAIDSPVGPPPLNRHAPISLPGTPTSMTAVPQAGASTPTSSFDFPRPSINLTAVTTSRPGAATTTSLGLFACSPQQAQSATRRDSVPGPSSLLLTESSASLAEPPSPASFLIRKPKADLLKKADDFARERTVREYYSKWKCRMSDITAWKEACRRSDAYKQKLSESGSSMSQSQSFKRRRESVDIHVKTEPARARRRLKARVSDLSDPRTDEQLVQRLTQNKEENERRWARGSFVKTVQKHVDMHCGHIPQNWTMWLCMNADNDRTAIWLEQKFDVPNSGNWESESIFTIHLSSKPSRESFPGLIVFELTPLEGIKDEIDRKYRILDDCSRLRDIVSQLSDRRHYVPSLLFINWDSSHVHEIAPDISHMVTKFTRSKVIRSFAIFSISSSDNDLDQLFNTSLATLDLDTRGELIERLTLRDLFERFTPSWREAAFVWLHACSSEDDDFDWRLFGHVCESFVESLNTLIFKVTGIWSPNVSNILPLPSLSMGMTDDAETIPHAIRDWLSSPVFDRDYLSSNFSVADFNEDFDARAFFDHLLDLAFLYAQKWANGAMSPRAVVKTGLAQSLSGYEKEFEASQKRLRGIARRLPLSRSRRSLPNGHISDWGSQASSPAPSTPINGAKRARLSMSEVSDVSRPPSPSPSVAQSTAESATSTVTIAMLRALTRDVLKTYGTNKSPGS